MAKYNTVTIPDATNAEMKQPAGIIYQQFNGSKVAGMNENESNNLHTLFSIRRIWEWEAPSDSIAISSSATATNCCQYSKCHVTFHFSRAREWPIG
jgi:hypothetical protein